VTAYVESSAVLRWLLAEQQGEEIRAFLAGASKVVCSRLTLIETRRVVRRAERDRRLMATEAVAVLATLSRAAVTWAVLEISAEVALRAESGFPAEPIRTLDAIHLASVLVLRQSLGDLVVVSTDDRVRTNAVHLGLPLLPAETS